MNIEPRFRYSSTGISRFLLGKKGEICGEGITFLRRCFYFLGDLDRIG
ncbi:hypothetical protein LEP1GSC058_3884 [Leptospira fainei serovar Hurstbridge str. BUT 6]|uniref:Uncharacterized protein n=1 Tax=Leptospira fainei serovar Hurstbridge str. BUT 6 TaxID=1193011 RepID=S3W035_9LEPT|nr:hypothetical protein LEP1GSC058_3884 [Leptospira fainei serovar Hurstbridge str. BUT 6]